MAEIKPFRALRFTKKAGDPASLLCPPYDIVSEPERRALLEKNPYNIIRLELPREGADPYQTAARTMESWIRDGILREDDEDSIYVYEEEFSVSGELKRIRGLVALLKLEEFEKGVVLPHENTLSKAKADRFALMDACHANFSLIYGLFSDPEKHARETIDRMASCAPENDLIGSDGIRHRLWRSTEKDLIDSLAAALRDKQIFIADGHHRYETALNYRNYLASKGLIRSPHDKANYVMAYLIDLDDPGLVVFPTHRVVHDLERFDKEELLMRASAWFTVTEYPDRKNAKAVLAEHADEVAFALCTNKTGFTLLVLNDRSALNAALPDKSSAYRELDVSALHTLILNGILKIDDANMANGVNLLYTRKIDEAFALVDQGKANCAFLLNPTKIPQIRSVADAGDKMPQKSTYFYPKLITGLTMNKLF